MLQLLLVHVLNGNTLAVPNDNSFTYGGLRASPIIVLLLSDKDGYQWVYRDRYVAQWCLPLPGRAVTYRWISYCYNAAFSAVSTLSCSALRFHALPACHLRLWVRYYKLTAPAANAWPRWCAIAALAIAHHIHVLRTARMMIKLSYSSLLDGTSIFIVGATCMTCTLVVMSCC